MNELNEIVSHLSQKPGVYQFLNAEGEIIYVGKAKNLKKRVSSYFTKQHDSAKTKLLVKQIINIKTIVVESEYDALLLENNLIKQHQPRYNVNLKDDKTYPWIVVKNERFPRVFYTRKYIKDGSQYFGPYASVALVNTLLDLIRQLYPLRNCTLLLSKENIESDKFKVCLEYHIGNCKGPCQAHQDEQDYNQSIEEIKQILKGNLASVSDLLRNKMDQYAASFEYEKAQIVKEKINILENYRSKSIVISQSIDELDVVMMISDEDISVANCLRLAHGAIIQSHTIEIKSKMEETPAEILSMAIAELRGRFNSKSNEVIVPFLPDVDFPDVTFTIPQRGEKRHLLLLSEKNIRQYMEELRLRKEKANPGLKTQRLLETIQKDLRLKELPYHIECFDNSNFAGSEAVAAMSVFKQAKPSKKDYRHFNIQTVQGINDFASMEEVIYRRYKRLSEESAPLPQLIVVDGGKGQLSAAVKSLRKLNLYGTIAIIGIAKRLEEIYFPDDSVPVYLDKRSETLKIIQQLRDEVHRFGITHHRKKRSKKIENSELLKIEGVGRKTMEELLKHFKSVKKIKEASVEELSSVCGEARAIKVSDYFNQNKLSE
ncbi:MAG TPA: excinuclease ABC subunit UvrC [Bacteroidia bacterium]|nr:excinuclease ABC subunit UvrC [Bacteroidia bacterium]HNT79671.1 excinuclease ABC subunit UvrC [Bacteroidia bacterium]